MSKGIVPHPSEGSQRLISQRLISQRFDPQIDAARATRPFRLGLLGGTFDPLHIGHLHIAERALEQYSLDGILFIPTGAPAHKTQTCVSDAEERYAMLHEALADNSSFDASRIEIERGGTTYTIDTLRILKERYGDRAELFFIVGADMAADMKTWKNSEEVAGLITVLCARRLISDEEERALVQNNLKFDIRFIDSSLIDISSRELREWVRTGKSIRYLVPDTVYAYIIRHGLYRERTRR